MYHYDLTKAQKKHLLACSGTILVGELASHHIKHPGTTSGDVIDFIRNGSDIIFNLTALSRQPKRLKQLESSDQKNVYVGIDSKQADFIINHPNYTVLPACEQIAHWYKQLQNKYIIFCVKPTVKPTHYHLNLEIVALEERQQTSFESEFIPLPYFNQTDTDFEHQLLSNRQLMTTQYTHLYDAPTYLKTTNSFYQLSEPLRPHTSHSARWTLSQHTSVKKIPLTDLQTIFNDYGLIGTSHLHFINIDALETLIAPLFENQQPISLEATHTIHTLAASSPHLFQNTTTPTTTHESFFLKDLQQLTRVAQLNYHLPDLINFHISVKTNPLTVVAGMSGTGKTQLAYLYAHLLGLSQDKQNLLFLPISPSYTEPSDLLGFLNPATQHYVSAETGLTELLLRAQKQPDELFMVIFDEMNLAQIEHWFAPFLSLLELEPARRNLRLYSSHSTCQNNNIYPSAVNIGQNVIFIGTVNLDETTKAFSDRLLDRINLVTLQKGSFKTMHAIESKLLPQTYTYKQFKSWLTPHMPLSTFTELELDFFDQLHELIHQYDHQKGVSYRFLNKLGDYIQNIPACETNTYTISKADAIDLGIKQRLLTKLTGSEQQFGSLIGTTKSPSEQPTDSLLFNLLTQEHVQSISSFDRCLTEIKRKAWELTLYGHTS